LVDLRREDEVVAREPSSGLRPAREGGPSPLEHHARVVAFRLGQQRDLHDEPKRAAEVLERELAGQATRAVALPARDFASEPGHPLFWERWRSWRVLLAVFVEELGNRRTVLMTATRGASNEADGELSVLLG
jgi:hypothetical protein